MTSPEQFLGNRIRLAREWGKDVEQVEQAEQREVLVQQLLRESLRLTIAAFPDIAQRIGSDEVRKRRIAEGWHRVLAEEGAL